MWRCDTHRGQRACVAVPNAAHRTHKLEQRFVNCSDESVNIFLFTGDVNWFINRLSFGVNASNKYDTKKDSNFNDPTLAHAAMVIWRTHLLHSGRCVFLSAATR